MTRLLRVGNFGAIHREGGQVISNDNEQSHSRTQITVAGKKYRIEIARLMGFAWGEKSVDALQWQVNHLNRGTMDDSNANLEAATPSRNSSHGRETNPARRSSGPRRGKPVRSWDPDAPGMRNYTYYESVRSAARETGADQGCVGKCCNGIYGSSKGLKFEFVDYAEVRGEEWRELTVNGAHVRVSNRQNYESQIGVRYAPIASDEDGNDYAKVKINGLVYYLSELIHAAFPKSGGYHGDDAQFDHITGIKSDNRPCNLRSVTPAVNVQSSYDIDDNRRSSVEKLGRKIRAFKPTSLIEGGDDAVAYFPSIRAASMSTGTRMGFISNQCNGDASGTSRQGWRFEAVAFVPRTRMMRGTTKFSVALPLHRKVCIAQSIGAARLGRSFYRPSFGRTVRARAAAVSAHSHHRERMRETTKRKTRLNVIMMSIVR